ncbi:MAG: hypothetical protein M4579_000047 [Chaenotheca gracillima]|nr:MAG: hypothetical protein M4579_000047 [Chaenotheca gracillima]
MAEASVADHDHDLDFQTDSPSFSWPPKRSGQKANGNSDVFTAEQDTPPLSNSSGSESTLTPEQQQQHQSQRLPQDLPHQSKSSSGISLRAFALGEVYGLALLSTAYLLFYSHDPAWRAPFFLVALSLFHFLEFWTTARFNTRHATVSSFLLSSNGTTYNLAHTGALAEFLLTHFFFSRSGHGFLSSNVHLLGTVVGLSLMALGQVVRSTAMAQAGQSFNHVVQTKRSEEHILVTHGVYAYLRHPSYFGFYWWGLGTQLMMGNVVCSWIYAVALYYFFSRRIQSESSFYSRLMLDRQMLTISEI